MPQTAAYDTAMATEFDRPVSELVTDLTRHLRVLFRQEVSLARAEITGKATLASRSIVLVAAGIGVAYAGLLTIAAGLCLVLWLLGLSAFLSAFIVGVVLAMLGYVLARVGIAGLRPARLAPSATAETMHESVEALKGSR
jgi:hypothetical protein